MRKAFFIFIFWNFCACMTWNFNVIGQYFKCEAHDGIFYCSNVLELNVIQTRKQNLFHLKIGNLILIFEKIKIKILNAVICDKKLNARATRNKLVFFILALYLLLGLLRGWEPPATGRNYALVVDFTQSTFIFNIMIINESISYTNGNIFIMVLSHLHRSHNYVSLHCAQLRFYKNVNAMQTLWCWVQSPCLNDLFCFVLFFSNA